MDHLVRLTGRRAAVLLAGLLTAALMSSGVAEAQKRARPASGKQSRIAKQKKAAAQKRARRSTRPRAREARARRRDREAKRALDPRIRGRFSPRAYKKSPVARHKIQSVLLAANAAASAFGVRPWRFLVVSKKAHPKQYEQVFQLLVEKNQEWVGRRPPVLIVGSYEKNFAKNGEPNPHGLHDLGMATATMSMQASKLGLSMRHMSGFDAEKAKKTLKIPKGFEPFSVTALGYAASPKVLPKEIQGKEGARRGKPSYQGEPTLGETAFYGSWGKAITN